MFRVLRVKKEHYVYLLCTIQLCGWMFKVIVASGNCSRVEEGNHKEEANLKLEIRTLTKLCQNYVSNTVSLEGRKWMLKCTRTFYILSRTLAANTLTRSSKWSWATLKNGVQNIPFDCYPTVTPKNILKWFCGKMFIATWYYVPWTPI